MENLRIVSGKSPQALFGIVTEHQLCGMTGQHEEAWALGPAIRWGWHGIGGEPACPGAYLLTV